MKEDRETAALRKWIGDVSQAAEAFERRWTLRALQRVDAALHQRLVEQKSLTDQAFVTGSAEDIAIHAGAMCRGWQAAVRAMEAAGEPDDAYVIGIDFKTGAKVAIGDRISAAARVAEIHGEAVVWLTPDEVATMYSAMEGFKTIDAIKRKFPGAEIVDVRPGDPAKSDTTQAA